jgi:exosortase/archaeosortase family protein
LRTAWGKLIFCLLTFPIAVVKNGVRIVTLSTLAVYVNPGFLYGNLHHRGGMAFFILGLLLMAGALKLIKLSESRIRMRAQPFPDATTEATGQDTPTVPVTWHDTGPKI